MKEDTFRDQLRPFLFDQTNQFVAELVSFAASPYDIRGYDKFVKYTKPESEVVITFAGHRGMFLLYFCFCLLSQKFTTMYILTITFIFFPNKNKK